LIIIFSSNWNLTFGNMVSLSVSICSLGLGIFALGVSTMSGIKSDINSNENFLRIVDHFEDKRIEITQKLYYEHDSKPFTTNIWKMRTYTDRAVKLYEMENIDDDNLKVFLEQLEKLLFESAIPWEGMSNTNKDDVNNVLKICEIFREFRLNDEQKKKLESYIDFISKLDNSIMKNNTQTPS
jgi:hypothetical protein